MRNDGGGVGGEAAAHGESEIGGRKGGDPSSAEDSQKMELVLTYEAFYAR